MPRLPLKKEDIVAFRSDTRPPEIVFKEGFHPKDHDKVMNFGIDGQAALDLFDTPEYREYNNDVKPSTAVCLSLKPSVCPIFPLNPSSLWSNMYIYAVKLEYSSKVNEVQRSRESPNAFAEEVAAKVVPPEDILFGVYCVRKGSFGNLIRTIDALDEFPPPYPPAFIAIKSLIFCLSGTIHYNLSTQENSKVCREAIQKIKKYQLQVWSSPSPYFDEIKHENFIDKLSDQPMQMKRSWQLESYVANCHICTEKFSASNNLIHCKSCGDLVCQQCSTMSMHLKSPILPQTGTEDLKARNQKLFAQYQQTPPKKPDSKLFRRKGKEVRYPAPPMNSIPLPPPEPMLDRSHDVCDKCYIFKSLHERKRPQRLSSHSIAVRPRSQSF